MIKAKSEKKMKQFKKLNICVITRPITTVVGAALLSNFMDVLEPLSNELFVITGKFPDRPNKRIHIIRIKSDDKKEFTLIRAIQYAVKQLRISYNLIKISKDVDIVIFHIGTGIDVLPILTAKLLGKRTIKVATGSSSKVAEGDNREVFGLGKLVFPFIFKILERIIFTLSNKIIIHSEDLIDQFGLYMYKNKISSSGDLFVDIHLFYWKNDLQKRKNVIGYVGRLSPEKGIMNFVKAIPLVLKERDDLEFLVGGDGSLFDKIKHELKTNGSYDKVELTRWIPHDELPDYLNELKLLVIPSYTESGPLIALEAMSCGTPILATPVGLIPAIVKDKETGFIMGDNSPECIAENIIRALEHPDLEGIVENARRLVEGKFTYEDAVERYRKILDNLRS